MARFAQAAVAGGACAIRANSPADVRAIRAAVKVPIIAISKEVQPDGRVLITPSFEAALQLQQAGADMIALECTARGQRAGALARIEQIQAKLGLLALADIATVAEADQAIEAGADAVLSTLRGYTDETADATRFEPAFIRELTTGNGVPIIAEGRIHSTAEARAAIEAGAFAVIVGTAITRPADITRSFSNAVQASFRKKRELRFFVGVDLGGTNVKHGIVSSRGDLVWNDVQPTPSQHGREALLSTLRQTVARTIAEAAGRDLPITSVGIATAGWVDVAKGAIAYATENLPGWTGTLVAQNIGDFCRLPVAVENDANALAVAENRFGAGQGLDNFAVVTLGTGIGGGCYIRGQLNRGSHFFANAIGHIPLIPEGLPCNCGRKGCLEVYANVAALLRYAGPAYTSADQVIRSANSGDCAASDAIRRLATYLARGCASLVGLLDPQAIILSGGIATDNPLLVECLRSELQPLVPTWERRNLQIMSSELGYFGGIYGAAAVAANSINEDVL